MRISEMRNYLFFIAFLLLCTSVIEAASPNTIEQAAQQLVSPDLKEVKQAKRLLVKAGDEAIDPVLRIGFHPKERNIRAVKNALYVLRDIGFDNVVDYLIEKIRNGETSEQVEAADYLNNLFFHPIKISSDQTKDVKEEAIQNWLSWWQANRNRFTPKKPELSSKELPKSTINTSRFIPYKNK